MLDNASFGHTLHVCSLNRQDNAAMKEEPQIKEPGELQMQPPSNMSDLGTGSNRMRRLHSRKLPRPYPQRLDPHWFQQLLVRENQAAMMSSR